MKNDYKIVNIATEDNDHNKDNDSTDSERVEALLGQENIETKKDIKNTKGEKCKYGKTIRRSTIEIYEVLERIHSRTCSILSKPHEMLRDVRNISVEMFRKLRNFSIVE